MKNSAWREYSDSRDWWICLCVISIVNLVRSCDIYRQSLICINLIIRKFFLTHPLNFYLGHLGNQERSLTIPDRSWSLIQRITENGLRYACGPIQFQTIRYIYWAFFDWRLSISDISMLLIWHYLLGSCSFLKGSFINDVTHTKLIFLTSPPPLSWSYVLCRLYLCHAITNTHTPLFHKMNNSYCH